MEAAFPHGIQRHRQSPRRSRGWTGDRGVTNDGYDMAKYNAFKEVYNVARTADLHK